MTIKLQNCEKCGNYRITGTMPCHTPSQLCDNCTSEILGIDVVEVRKEMQQHLKEQVRNANSGV